MRLQLITILAFIITVISIPVDDPDDCTARHRLIEIIRAFDHSMLIATHDLDLAAQLCPRSLLMSKGRIIADAPTADILSDQALLASAGLFV